MTNYRHILRQCRNGEHSAQTEFYALFHKSVYNSCLRILEDPMEAEEVMQETFLKVLTRKELLKEDPVAMEAMLKRIAINHAIDILRRRKIRFTRLDLLHEPTDEQTPDDVPYTDLSVGDIKEAIAGLSKGYGLILTLKLIEGMEYEDIAKQLDLSPSSVRAHYSRARKKLSSLLNIKGEK